MPAAGLVTRRDQVSYGVGVFSQGDMGAEFAKGSVLQGAGSERGFQLFQRR